MIIYDNNNSFLLILLLKLFEEFYVIENYEGKNKIVKKEYMSVKDVWCNGNALGFDPIDPSSNLGTSLFFYFFVQR